MRHPTLTPALLCSLLLASMSVACGGGATPSSSGDASTDVAPSDAASSEASVCPPGTMPRSLQHYARCSCDMECPMGDSCSAPPVNQTDPPRICRPACTASSTCFTATRELGGSPNCAPDGFCWAYCARTGAIGACTAAATCSTSGAPDGFCIRN